MLLLLLLLLPRGCCLRAVLALLVVGSNRSY